MTEVLASSQNVVTGQDGEPQDSPAAEGHENDGETGESDSAKEESVNPMKAETKSRAHYSRDNLLSLRESPVSKLWPTILGNEYVRNGIWDPEVWHQSSESAKRCASPADDLRRQIIMEDGIILSPQRQSFGQGCQIPQSAPERGSQQDRLKSMLSHADIRERDGRSRLTGRVGRGRTIDFKERTPLRERNKESNNHKGSREQDHDRADRDRNKKRGSRNAEPEWMTFGPSSQFDTVELTGFGGDIEKGESVSGKKQEKCSVKKNKTVNGEVQDNASKVKENAVKEEQNAKAKGDEEADKENGEDNATAFDINQFFMSDTVLPMSGGYDHSGSRFCQFFRPGQPGSNYSSSSSRRSSIAEELMERTGLSSSGRGTPRSPSPLQQFGFTPIVPAVDAKADAEALEDILTRSKLDVKPMLEKVMSAERDAARVKGPVRLEDIEATVTKVTKPGETVPNEVENTEDTRVGEDSGAAMQDMKAFQLLVQQMKTSGTLPEKSYPAISGLPSYLLPQPPSPKSKSARRTPSPLQKALRRSPSPTYMLHQALLQGQLPRPTAHSPAQVVPQMDGSNSPFNKSLVKSPQDLFTSPVLHRSASPLSMVPEGSLHHVNHAPPRSVPPSSCVIHKPVPQPAPSHSEPRKAPGPAEGSRAPPPSQAATPSKPVHLLGQGFMPTSVLRKYGGLDKTPKEPTDGKKDVTKAAAGKDTVVGKLEFGSGAPAASTAVDRPGGASPSQAPALNGPSSPRQTQPGSAALQKPTAFKPYPSSPLVPAGNKSGSQSEPQSPLYTMAKAASSPSRSLQLVSHSAPTTPHRHALADKPALLLPAQVRHALSRRADAQPGMEQASRADARANGRQQQQQQPEQRPPPAPAAANPALITAGYGGFNLDWDHLQHRPDSGYADQRHALGPHRNGLPPHVVPRGPGEPRPNPAAGFSHFGPRPVRSMPSMPSGRVSPCMLGAGGAFGSRFPRTPFNSPMAGVPGMPHPRMLPPPGVLQQRGLPHPALMRPGTHAPVQRGLPLGPPPLQHAGRFMPPGQHHPHPHHPALYGGGQVPMYPPVNPAGHVAMGAGARPLHVNRGPSPVSAPPQPPSSGNILSQWFSEDMLKQAGPRTSLGPEVARRILSVEDLEQQQQAAVRN